MSPLNNSSGNLRINGVNMGKNDTAIPAIVASGMITLTAQVDGSAVFMPPSHRSAKEKGEVLDSGATGGDPHELVSPADTNNSKLAFRYSNGKTPTNDYEPINVITKNRDSFGARVKLMQRKEGRTSTNEV
jgi:hypothetical protein